MTRIAITGASGFIGRHLADRLLDQGCEVVRIVRSRAHDPGTHVVVDYSSVPALVDVLQGAQAVVHLAAIVHKPSGEAAADEYRRVNVDMALDVARAAAEAGARMVFVSSAGVLGNVSPPEGLDDDSPPRPFDLYTRSKLEAEVRLGEWADSTGAELAIVRPPVVLGPGAPGNFGRLLRAAGRIPLPLGSINAPRSFVGARNLADAIQQACCSPLAARRTLLVAEARPWSVRQIATAIAQARGRPARVFGVPAWLVKSSLAIAGRADDVSRLYNPLVLCPTVLPKVIGWRPPYSTEGEIEWASGRHS